MILEFQGRVRQDGTTHIINRDEFNRLMALNFLDQDITIRVEKKKSKRTTLQNRYYWGGVVPIIQKAFKDLGHNLTKEQTHEFMRLRFLKDTMVNVDTGELIGEMIKSTTELTKAEFADYITEIQQFAAEVLNVQIPNPNEQLTI